MRCRASDCDMYGTKENLYYCTRCYHKVIGAYDTTSPKVYANPDVKLRSSGSPMLSSYSTSSGQRSVESERTQGRTRSPPLTSTPHYTPAGWVDPSVYNGSATDGLHGSQRPLTGAKSSDVYANQGAFGTDSSDTFCHVSIPQGDEASSSSELPATLPKSSTLSGSTISNIRKRITKIGTKGKALGPVSEVGHVKAAAVPSSAAAASAVVPQGKKVATIKTYTHEEGDNGASVDSAKPVLQAASSAPLPSNLLSQQNSVFQKFQNMKLGGGGHTQEDKKSPGANARNVSEGSSSHYHNFVKRHAL